jgi:hypothetical protein
MQRVVYSYSIHTMVFFFFPKNKEKVTRHRWAVNKKKREINKYLKEQC